MYVCVAHVCVTVYISPLTACVDEHARMRGAPIPFDRGPVVILLLVRS